MKRTTIVITLTLAGTLAAFAQDPQTVAAEAAAALSAAEDVPVVTPKPKYWNETVLTNINLGQTYLSNWAAGGYNSVALAANIDANANYAKEKMIWTNRLQFDYGFLYSEDKPLMQKNKDRIYFESKWGYETPIRHLSYSASFDFKTQFDRNWDYKTPSGTTAGTEPTKNEWKAARVLKSDIFSPAYVNLGVGLLWTPKPWFSLNVSPLTGGFVIVQSERLRQTYGMELRQDGLDTSVGANYKSSRFELGAQVKADAKWVINDAFSYTTQLVLFSDYLGKPQNLRVNWDNKVFWKLAKYFALTVSTNLIYDDTIKQKEKTRTLPDGSAETYKVQAVQFKEFLEFGFTYTIAHKS
ncbi:MAG: DUF3078 domain-containing protein [Bacteroidales bacterium]|nr:DUF3078 domain-containing protein [Bacteroidales bacterium]